MVTISNWITKLEQNGYVQREIIYKDGSKEVEERRIYIAPIKENFDTSPKKFGEGIKEIFNTPLQKNFKDNNTLINNTMNNTHITAAKAAVGCDVIKNNDISNKEEQYDDDEEEGRSVTVTLHNAIKKNKRKSNIYDEQVNQIFDFYKQTFDGYFKRLTLTNGRKTKIEARLKAGYTVDDICTAIKNIRKSAFHCGDNDKHMFYATLEFICRNDETLEKWINADKTMGGNGYGTYRQDYNAGNGNDDAIANDKLFTRGLD
jgi:hypothetical protein